MADTVLVLGGFGDPPKLPEHSGGGGGGGGGGEAVLVNKTITANGTYYASSDNADGYKKVVANVQPKLQTKTVEIYTNGTTPVAPDSGKDGLSSVSVEVDVQPDLQSKSVTINSNGTTTVSPDTGKDGLSSVSITAAVPNTYSAGDEGKVVSSGALVSQSSATYTSNATYDTTLKNSVTVNVANSYTAGDEGKVVSSGALVAQSSDSTTANGTFDTTLINSFTVNVAGSAGLTFEQVAGGTSSLASIDITLETATQVRERAFSEISTIGKVHAKNVTKLGGYAFAGSGITCFVGEKKITGGNYNVFSGCGQLTAVDITASASFSSNWFQSCSNMTVLILRRTDAITSCASTGAFSGSAFSSSGQGGTLYVPASLKSTYESASNWSTILGYANNSIATIEGSIYATKYADGTTIPT